MKNKLNSLACGLILSALITGIGRADVSITVSPNGLGGTIVEFSDGTGLTSQGQNNAFIAYGTAGDTFLVNGAFSQSLASPVIVLGGSESSAIFASDINGAGGLNSVFEFDFRSSVPIGSSVSDLNGTYELTGILFANFVPGNYDLQIFDGGPGGVDPTNIGDVALRVVPEPSATWFLIGLGGLISTYRRRK